VPRNPGWQRSTAAIWGRTSDRPPLPIESTTPTPFFTSAMTQYFSAQFGVTSPVGQMTFSEVRAVSGDGNSFLAIAGGFPLTESVLISLPDHFTRLGGSIAGTSGNP